MLNGLHPGFRALPLSHAHIQRQPRGPPLLAHRPPHSMGPALPVLPCLARLAPVGGPVNLVGLLFPTPRPGLPPAGRI